MVDIKDIIGTSYNSIKISKENLFNIVPKDALYLLPIGDANLLVKISLRDLENLGFSFEDYKLICKVYKKDGEFYLKICPN